MGRLVFQESMKLNNSRTSLFNFLMGLLLIIGYTSCSESKTGAAQTTNENAINQVSITPDTGYPRIFPLPNQTDR